MKTITICGSMKFTKQMIEIAWKLESEHGYNVLQCVYHEGDEPLTKEVLGNLKLAHNRKIDLSDAIYVVNIDGYLGTAVKNEIRYAQQRGKEVIYHSEQLIINNIQDKAH